MPSTSRLYGSLRHPVRRAAHVTAPRRAPSRSPADRSTAPGASEPCRARPEARPPVRLRPSSASARTRPRGAPQRGLRVDLSLHPREHDRGSLAPVGERCAGGAVQRRPCHLGRRTGSPPASDSCGVHGSRVGGPPGSAPGKIRMPSAGSRSGPQTKQVGKGCLPLQRSYPASAARAASAGVADTGTSRSSCSSLRALATTVSPSRDSDDAALALAQLQLGVERRRRAQRHLGRRRSRAPGAPTPQV